MGAFTYSGTAGSNTAVDGIGSQGSDSPDNIDNLVRALAASDANLVRDLGGANTVGGSADAITVTLADATAATAYFDGMRFSFRAGSDTTTTAPTLNVDSIGTKTIKKAILGVESALAVGDIQAGATCEVVYRSAWASAVGAFELLGITASPTFEDVTVNDDLTLSNGRLVVKTSTAQNNLIQRFSADNGGPVLNLDKSRNASIDGQTIVQDNDILGVINFNGSDGVQFITAAQIAAIANGTPGTNDMPGGLLLSTTADGGSSVTERLGIFQGGAWRISGVSGSNGQVVKQVAGATAWGGVSTFMGEQSAPQGATVDFNSIPSWVREIDVIFVELSTTGTSRKLLQIGDSGGIETTGYVSQANFLAGSISTVSSTQGWMFEDTAAASNLSGMWNLKNIYGNMWVCTGMLRLSGATNIVAGHKELSGTLDRIRFTTVGGTDTMDAGSINVCYR